MKRLTRLSIASAIALILAVAAVGVWAGPFRPGTVPTPPPDGIGNCVGGSSVNLGTGTVQVTGETCQVSVTRDSSHRASPAGWASLLSDVLEVKLVNGAVSQVEVCVPLNPDWKAKVAGASINFFYWNTSKNTWIAIPTVIKNNETPPVVCGTSASAGFYALFGK